MALNKNKVIAAAQRFTQKGQYDRAIKEYRSIVDEEPDDVRIWLKIGDLYTKKGATSQAISTYVRVANQYADKGFHLKAVAVYKKILNIDPSYIDAHKSLGDLYVTLGLGPDAVAQYQIVVGSYERDARYTDSLELLKMIVQLGPDDHANRIRLAEAHARLGQMTEAIDQFKHVLEQLDALGHLDEYVQVAERLLYVAPEELDVVRDLSKVYLRRGDAKRALARLQVLFRADPHNVGTLELLAQAFHEIGQTAKAVSVYRELARIHGEAGDTNAQVAAYRKLLGVQPDDEEALRATGGLDIQGRASATAPGPAASSEEAMTREEQISQFLGDIDIYRKYGLKDHAQERIAKVLELDPGNLAALERRRDLCLENEDKAGAIKALLQAAEVASRRDPHRAMGYLGEVLQHDPGNADATARMKALSSGMAEQLASSDAQPAIAPPAEDAFDVDLDLGELDFEDDLDAELGGELDLDADEG
ncbi:MAG: tetratricopeptide repeat protein, partial [Myxococcales bacterium]|nr:tetratricopeptide repeat protein [Myxococcales bacterium]